MQTLKHITYIPQYTPAFTIKTPPTNMPQPQIVICYCVMFFATVPVYATHDIYMQNTPAYTQPYQCISLTDRLLEFCMIEFYIYMLIAIHHETHTAIINLRHCIKPTVSPQLRTYIHCTPTQSYHQLGMFYD